MLDLLQGIRIISFNHFLLGPMGIQALADLGADVIAVEAPEGAWQRHWSSGDIWHDGQGMLHLCSNRNKRSVALDLKAPERSRSSSSTAPTWWPRISAPVSWTSSASATTPCGGASRL